MVVDRLVVIRGLPHAAQHFVRVVGHMLHFVVVWGRWTLVLVKLQSAHDSAQAQARCQLYSEYAWRLRLRRVAAEAVAAQCGD